MGWQGPAGLVTSADIARGMACIGVSAWPALGSLHVYDRDYIGKGVKELTDFQLHSPTSRSECAEDASFLWVIWQLWVCLLRHLFEPQLLCSDRVNLRGKKIISLFFLLEKCLAVKNNRTYLYNFSIGDEKPWLKERYI